MNTSGESSADVKPAITEADVVAWLRAKAETIREHTGIPHAIVTLTVNVGAHSHVSFSAHGDNLCRLGGSVDGSIGQLLRDLGSASERAAKKRADAAKLLADAEALDGVATLPAKEAA